MNLGDSFRFSGVLSRLQQILLSWKYQEREITFFNRKQYQAIRKYLSLAPLKVGNYKHQVILSFPKIT